MISLREVIVLFRFLIEETCTEGTSICWKPDSSVGLYYPEPTFWSRRSLPFVTYLARKDLGHMSLMEGQKWEELPSFTSLLFSSLSFSSVLFPSLHFTSLHSLSLPSNDPITVNRKPKRGDGRAPNRQQAKNKQVRTKKQYFSYFLWTLSAVSLSLSLSLFPYFVIYY